MAIIEVALAIHVAITIARHRRRMMASAVHATIVPASVLLIAHLAAVAPLAALAPAVRAVAAVAAPLEEVVAHVLVAAVVVLADKRSVNPNLNPLFKKYKL